MTGGASNKPDAGQAGPAEKDLPSPSDIARDAAIEAAIALKTAGQLLVENVGDEESSLLFPPVTPRRRR